MFPKRMSTPLSDEVSEVEEVSTVDRFSSICNPIDGGSFGSFYHPIQASFSDIVQVPQELSRPYVQYVGSSSSEVPIYPPPVLGGHWVPISKIALSMMMSSCFNHQLGLRIDTSISVQFFSW